MSEATETPAESQLKTTGSPKETTQEAEEKLPELPTRWEVELEFVQSLANLQYVNYLAQNKFFEDEKLLNYLKYLDYWRQPEYAQYLVYPNCLHILTLLQTEQFRKDITKLDTVGKLMADMETRWRATKVDFSGKSDEEAGGPLEVSAGAVKPEESAKDGDVVMEDAGSAGPTAGKT